MNRERTARRRIIEIAIIPNVTAVDRTPRQIGADFRRLLGSGTELRVDGRGKDDPEALLGQGYSPKYEIRLFGTRFFICNPREAHDLKLLPAWIVPPARSHRRAYARVLYKDSSLVWRAASHYINTPDEQWIGKGAVRSIKKNGRIHYYSAEETTNLPFEIQQAVDDVSRRGPRPRADRRVLFLMLRNAPSDRIWPYQDFTGPRQRAMKVAANRINNSRPIAWFDTPGDPASLRIEPGFEPDFKAAVDVYPSYSKAYGGDVRKFRIASKNREIQYLYITSPFHTWIVHPQTFTTELSSYGLRTVDVMADEDIAIPGYEFADNDGSGEVDDQIPAGYAGDVCPFDPDRADASPWNHRLSIIRSFRRSKLYRDARRDMK